MRANRTIYFQMENFEQFGGFENMPKGELFRFTVNPYNGKVCLVFNDKHFNGCAVAESVLNQVTRDLHLLAMSGSDNPLLEYAEMADKGELESIRDKAAKVSVYKKRSEEKAAGSKAS